MNRRAVAGLLAAVAVAVGAVLILVLVLAPGPGKPPVGRPLPAGPPPSMQIGANVNLLFNPPGVSAAELGSQLSALHASGATIARSDALWEATEPVPPVGGVHRYDWRFDDRIAAALAAHDLRWLPIVDYSAGWARSILGQDHSPPRSDADYAAYAQALAARYGAGGSFWRAHPELADLPVTAFEIWNEPDGGAFWFPRPDPAGYGRLYGAALGAIHAVDPGARVLVGGLESAPTFMPALLSVAPQLRSSIDGVAIHPYGSSPAAVLASVAAARRTLDGLGLDAVPLYVTEFGWTTSPPGALDYLPERLRPGYVQLTLIELGRSTCGIAAAILYTWFSPQRNPSDSGQWFGISAPGAGRSPDAASFAGGVLAVERSRAGTGGCL